LVAFGLVQFTEFHYNLSASTTAIGLSGKTEKCRSIRESAPWELRVSIELDVILLPLTESVIARGSAQLIFKTQ
jgi:hypothetical protein